MLKSASEIPDSSIRLKVNIDHLDEQKNPELVYKKWASTYESEFSRSNYAGPSLTAKAVFDHYKDKEIGQIKVMDVAAGTGFVGENLHDLGFRNIDAIDCCPEMLKILEAKNVYSRVLCEKIVQNEELDNISENTYDAVVMSGGFVKGHVPLYVLDEMIRMCKRDGIIVICMRLEYLSIVQEYTKLEDKVRDLELNGKWKLVSRVVTQKYILDKDGVTFCFRKL